MKGAVSTRPAVSVIIPTHNRAELLPRAIQSVLAQTFRDFELIIVDDASSDSTQAVARALQSSDARIRYIRHGANQGEGASRNTGIAAALGEFIAFLDDDDEWVRRKLEAQLAVFQSPTVGNPGLVYCGAIYADASTGEELGRVQARKRDALLCDLLDSNCIIAGASTAMVEREVFKLCGFFNTAPVLHDGEGTDWEMWIRIARGYGFDFVDEPLARIYYRLGPSLTSNELAWANKARAHEHILEQQRAIIPKCLRSASNALHRIRRLYVYGGMVAQGRKRFVDALRLNPGNPKAWLSLVASLFGPGFYRWAYERALPIWGNPDYRTVTQASLRSGRGAKA